MTERFDLRLIISHEWLNVLFYDDSMLPMNNSRKENHVASDSPITSPLLDRSWKHTGQYLANWLNPWARLGA